MPLSGYSESSNLVNSHGFRNNVLKFYLSAERGAYAHLFFEKEFVHIRSSASRLLQTWIIVAWPIIALRAC